MILNYRSKGDLRNIYDVKSGVIHPALIGYYIYD